MMEKGVQKRRSATSKRRKSRGLAKAVAEYLLSDSYMYAPLIDSPPPVSGSGPDPPPPPTHVRSPPSNAAGTPLPVAQLRRLLVK